MTIGVLALQGDVREHVAAFAELGEATREVRRPAELAGLAGIVLPGGESTTLSMLLESSGLFEPLADALGAGLPVFGTCAGLVLLSRRVIDGRPDQRSFGVLDCAVRRNGYGRQRFSFEALVDATALDATSPAATDPEAAGSAAVGSEAGRRAGGATGSGRRRDTMPAVFIRAPVVVELGPGVEVLVTLDPGADGPPDPVACRQGAVLASSFHPELTPDRRLHRLFSQMVRSVA